MTHDSVYFLIPETKGLSLEYMDRLFDGEPIPTADIENARAGLDEKEKGDFDHIEVSRGGAPVLATFKE